MISSVYVRLPKYETPILDAIKKNIDTKNIDMNNSTHAIGVKISNKFQIGEVLGGN